ncbi:hypothetical protein BCT30_07350 [Enterovibrio norvegicus]|uniref:ATPase n=1 Tax=Enterovibrio norvegicus DSM 15893 TaxID=1121869 RepID=A0A1I5L7X8_9GAMM|nr:hypothetical protein [Enterovibrio norvegicus]MCC4797121.1 hypothetical protein [Enterovibrio norvegicus]PMI40846.1 hypothetical protein BCU46_05480 [Enterovibrio norvegicus]PMN56266.1 hypothetical protein BCT30_07350 [Enterovibrio norvegicus]SFO93282.1 hypothetical protein SAMN03084138_00853 [Enterovibrio norvegicus DSM 15893]
MNRFNRPALAVLIIASLSACQSTSEPRQAVSDTNKPAMQENQNTLQVYEKAKSDYSTWLEKVAESKTLVIYSKGTVNTLFDAWDDAVDVYDEFASNPAKTMESYSVFSSGTYADKFNGYLATVSVQYDKLQGLKKTADSLLADSIAEMAYLNEIDAKSVYATKFRSVERDYYKLYSYVEDNEIDDAQVKQAEFLQKAKQLEALVAMKRNIAPLQTEIATLRKQGFKTVAPISYTKTSAALEQAQAVVNLNPRDAKAIGVAVEDVQFEIAHLKHIGQEVKKFKNVDDDKFEPLILELENRLHVIAQTLDDLDLRNTPMQRQADVLADKVAQLNEKANLESAAADANADPQLAALVARLDAVNADLSSKQSKNQVLTAQVTALEMANENNESLIGDLKSIINTIKPEALNPFLDKKAGGLPDTNLTPASSVNPVTSTASN